VSAETAPGGAFAQYWRVLRRPHVAPLLAVGFLGRLPHSVTAVLVTLHVTHTLGMDYLYAGMAAAILTIGIAFGSPWRGRRIDTVGLRRAVVPSIIVEGLAWGLAPFVSYPFLLVLLFAAGLYSLPVFTIIRQSLSVMMRGDDRRTSFSLDSMVTELVFILGPGGSAVVASLLSSKVALLATGALVVLAGVVLLWRNPPTRSSQLEGTEHREAIGELEAPGRYDEAPVVTGAIPVVNAQAPAPGRFSWVTPGVIAMLIMSAGAGMSLSGTEVGVVAFSEHAGDTSMGLWWAYGVWSAASLVGGFLYGAQKRRYDPLGIITVMGIALIPAAFAPDMFWLGLLLVLSGFFVAPLMTAASERLTEQVVERHRGEAMGWYGSAMTAGTALGTPLVGVVIDTAGPQTAFLALAGVAIVTGLGTIALRSARRARRA
jgi:predicted MFS family arabinose efflux permease